MNRFTELLPRYGEYADLRDSWKTFLVAAGLVATRPIRLNNVRARCH